LAQDFCFFHGRLSLTGPERPASKYPLVSPCGRRITFRYRAEMLCWTWLLCLTIVTVVEEGTAVLDFTRQDHNSLQPKANSRSMMRREGQRKGISNAAGEKVGGGHLQAVEIGGQAEIVSLFYHQDKRKAADGRQHSSNSPSEGFSSTDHLAVKGKSGTKSEATVRAVTATATTTTTAVTASQAGQGPGRGAVVVMTTMTPAVVVMTTLTTAVVTT